MKECSYCHASCADTAGFCTSCGTPFPAQASYAPAPAENNYYYPPQQPCAPAVSYGDFVRKYAGQETKKLINPSFIAWLVFAGINLILGAAFGSVGSVFLDIAIMIGLAFWWKYTASTACAIVSTVYGAFNLIYVSISMGNLGGYLPLIAAIAEFGALKKVKEQYQYFLSGAQNSYSGAQYGSGAEDPYGRNY